MLPPLLRLAAGGQSNNLALFAAHGREQIGRFRCLPAMMPSCLLSPIVELTGGNLLAIEDSKLLWVVASEIV
jgi:hypothetical protein